jgi:EAL domain-containing protein (putative c-di-GMP-specific phosphodiesterase class I)/GGDEF domain-containing protein
VSPQSPQNPHPELPDVAIGADVDALDRLRDLLGALGVTSRVAGGDPSRPLLELSADGNAEALLDDVLHAAREQAEDLQTVLELEAVERIASIGRFRVEDEGSLRLSEEAARLLGDAIHVDEICAQADGGQRDRLRSWLYGTEELRSEMVEARLTSADGRSRRLRFIDAGDANRRRGYVQAVEFLPTRPPLAVELEPFDIGHETGERLRAAIAAARRHDRPLAIMALHFDHPDLAELPASEQLGAMKALQSRFARLLRAEDVCGAISCRRTGGHELLISAEVETHYQALVLARRLVASSTEPLGVSGATFTLDVQLGVALLNIDGIETEDLVESAIRASETSSEHRITFASSEVDDALAARLELECDLAEAVAKGEIVPFYQPKVDAMTEQIVGVEALARWIHPVRGLVNPGEFIPLAEENGMILEIGQSILRQACEDAVAWKEQGLKPIRVAVNLSPAQFAQGDLVDRVFEVLDETGLDPDLLELELTESMLMDDAEAAVTILRRFERKGIHLAIDDFGTGYSSLSYLRRLPINALKIDRAFIHDVNVNPDDAAIATSIILLGRSLKLRVVAEGVETRKQLEFLRVMQCNEIQGFLYSKPVPQEEAVELFRRLGA